MAWKRYIPLMDDPGAFQKTCQQCGSSFGCGAAAGKCWCEELPALAEPADGDCLCPACLRAAAGEQMRREKQSSV
jgi:hypothetical protein